MRVAVLADIHGNRVALDAVLDDLDGADEIVCLGDVSEGGPQPREALERVRELGCPVVMGNCDAWFLDFRTDGVPEERVDRGRWALEQLGAEGLDLIRSFRDTLELDLGDGTLLCFHGTPRSNEEILLPGAPDHELEEKLEGIEQRFLTGGHVHVQWLRHVRSSTFFNPGTVGMANDLLRAAREAGFDDHAEYALLEVDGRRFSVEFRRVPYDVERLVRAVFESGLPHPEEAAEKWRRG